MIGRGAYATSTTLQEKFGSAATVISIGQAGELQLTGAGIAVTGEKDQRSNFAARGGLGAVMGSKGIKAIVIEEPQKSALHYANAELFKTTSKNFAQKLISDPKLGAQGSQHLYGTASIVGAAYACVQILADAIERAGTLDRGAVREALTDTDMMTAIGQVSFNADTTGNVLNPLVQWQSSKMELVGPLDLKTADFKIPGQ